MYVVSHTLSASFQRAEIFLSCLFAVVFPTPSYVTVMVVIVVGTHRQDREVWEI